MLSHSFSTNDSSEFPHTIAQPGDQSIQGYKNRIRVINNKLYAVLDKLHNRTISQEFLLGILL